MDTYDKNGLITLNIPATGDYAGTRLPNSNDYFQTLNEEGYAFSIHDGFGCITDPVRFDGSYIENNPGEFGIILGHEFCPFIYRGQNKNFPHFVPTANRYSLENDDNKLKHCVDWIKKQEFLQLFKTMPYYERCQNFQVLNCKFKFDLEAVAQHYEFMSNYIDITKDIAVALFFAYTYQIDGVYYPITDFEEYNPTLYIGNLKTIYNHYPDCLKIIGFQSLLRPHLQKAMAIEIKSEDVVKPLFEEVALPKSSTIANEIFYRANCGKNLFPNEMVDNIAMQVRNDKHLSNAFLNDYCDLYQCKLETMQNKLQNNGFELTDKEWGLPEKLIRRINMELDTQIIPYLNDRIAFRGVSEPLRPEQ